MFPIKGSIIIYYKFVCDQHSSCPVIVPVTIFCGTVGQLYHKCTVKIMDLIKIMDSMWFYLEVKIWGA